VAGDGAIQMSINELATMRDHRAKNVLVVVVVNSRLGRVQNETWGPTLYKLMAIPADKYCLPATTK